MIQILDGYEYLPDRQALSIKAMVSGAMVDCIVLNVFKEDAESFYNSKQFDIEELLTQRIEDEEYNSRGEVECSALIFKD